MNLKKLTVPLVLALTALTAQNAVANSKIDACVSQWADAYRKEVRDPEAMIVNAQIEEWKGWCKKGKTPKVKASSNMVTVPQINGNCDNSNEVIKAAGLKPKRIAVHGPVDPDASGIGCAYRQHPKAGTQVRKGSRVTYRSWWEAS